MPSGYTAGVESGEVTDFATFALTCARAFGALIEMRDEPLDAAIPEFKPSDYNARRLAETQEELAQLTAMSDDEVRCKMEAEATKRREAAKAGLAKAATVAARYDAMLAKVQAWEPPTKDHVQLKTYMVDQLVQSKNGDCHTDYYRSELHHANAPVDVETWRKERIEHLTGNIAYYTKQDAEERVRVAQRNRWVRELRESLLTAKVGD